ncbi:MAG: sulfur carrier protein ThiS [Rhodopirellula sp.]|nr:sulfur carrier protein ThiS [Rhodopirellula sp.]
MEIIVNGETRQVAEGATIAELLATLSLTGKFVAVELNREVIPRPRHGEQRLASGDRLEIVTLVGGG